MSRGRNGVARARAEIPLPINNTRVSSAPHVAWRLAPVSSIAFSLLVATMACARTPVDVPSSPGLVVQWSAEACARTTDDADSDGLHDGCELALAQAFAPELVVDSLDCLWQGGATPPRLGGGYFFAAQPAPNGARIAFLPAYYRDCGWSGRVCVLRGRDCGAHAGDSELIVVDVEPTGREHGWQATAVFLSAHCSGRSDGRCRWYRGNDLRPFTWADGRHRGAPRVWVARGKHGNYPSARECDSGHWFYDSCDHNDTVVRFPVVSSRQNLGSRDHWLLGAGGCLGSENLPLGGIGTVRGSQECLWDSSRPFRGWQTDSQSASTSYGRHLRGVGF